MVLSVGIAIPAYATGVINIKSYGALSSRTEQGRVIYLPAKDMYTISTAITQLEESITGKWDSTKIYQKGDYCYYDGDVYVCLILTNGSKPTDTHYWQKVNVSKKFSDSTTKLNEVQSDVTDEVMQDINDLGKNFAQSYMDGASYNEGDLVMYKNLLYRCTSASEGTLPSDTSHFQRTTVSAELDKLRKICK